MYIQLGWMSSQELAMMDHGVEWCLASRWQPGEPLAASRRVIGIMQFEQLPPCKIELGVKVCWHKHVCTF